MCIMFDCLIDLNNFYSYRVVFAEMVHTNKLMMKDCTVIDASWLEILAPHYYEKHSIRT